MLKRNTPGCGCKITAARSIPSGYGNPCQIRVDWCTKGDNPTLQIGSQPEFPVPRSGFAAFANAGPFTLKSTLCGNLVECSAGPVALCPYSSRRLRITIESSEHTSSGVCDDAIISNIYENIIGTDIDAILDFDYDQDCEALVDFPIEIDLGEWTIEAGASGTYPLGAWSSDVSESFSLTYHFNNVFPNGVQCPTYPLPMDFFVYDNYTFDIAYVHNNASQQTRAGCTSFSWACTIDDSTQHRFFYQLRMPLCLPSDITGSTGGLNPYANGYPIADSNARYCSTCTRSTNDTTVPSGTIYLNRLLLGSFSWSNTPC